MMAGLSFLMRGLFGLLGVSGSCDFSGLRGVAIVGVLVSIRIAHYNVLLLAR